MERCHVGSFCGGEYEIEDKDGVTVKVADCVCDEGSFEYYKRMSDGALLKIGCRSECNIPNGMKIFSHVICIWDDVNKVNPNPDWGCESGFAKQGNKCN